MIAELAKMTKSWSRGITRVAKYGQHIATKQRNTVIACAHMSTISDIELVDVLHEAKVVTVNTTAHSVNPNRSRRKRAMA